MATYADNDEFRGLTCSPCERGTPPRGHEATKYCIDCKDHLCNDCQLAHGRFAQFVNHDVTPITLVPRDRVMIKDLSNIRGSSTTLDAMAIQCVSSLEERMTLISDFQKNPVIVLNREFETIELKACGPGYPYGLAALTSVGLVAYTTPNCKQMRYIPYSQTAIKSGLTLNDVLMPYACRGMSTHTIILKIVKRKYGFVSFVIDIQSCI